MKTCGCLTCTDWKALHLLGYIRLEGFKSAFLINLITLRSEVKCYFCLLWKSLAIFTVSLLTHVPLFISLNLRQSQSLVWELLCWIKLHKKSTCLHFPFGKGTTQCIYGLPLTGMVIVCYFWKNSLKNYNEVQKPLNLGWAGLVENFLLLYFRWNY